MSQRVKQIDPQPKNKQFVSSRSEDKPSFNRKIERPIFSEYEEKLIGDFALFGSGVGAGVFGGAAMLGFPLAGAALAPVGAVVGGAVGALAGTAAAVADKVLNDPPSSDSEAAALIEEPFGVSAVQGGSSNDPVMVDGVTGPFGVEASQNMSTFQQSMMQSSNSRLVNEPTLNKSEEASTSWIA